MQDIREIEFRDSGSNANTKICFEVRATALCPRLHTEGFHYAHTGPPTKRISIEEFIITNLGVHNSSLYHNHLYSRGKVQSQNNNHFYTRGIRAQSQTTPQSSLHKRDSHKPKAQPPLHWGICINPKQRRDYNLVISKTTNNSWCSQ